jgi:tetratricopeptide (TPR) repeat protein
MMSGPAQAALVMACIGFSVCAGSEARAQAPASRPAILVVPFSSEGRDPRGYWLREASAVILTDEFASLGVTAMSRDERLSAFDSLRVPATAPLSHATVIRVGQVVGAMRVVVGSCAISGDTLTVRARSILLDNGQISAEIVETGPLANLFDVYERVARRLAEGLPRGPTAPMSRPPVAAFEQYIKGLLAETPAMKLSFLRAVLRLAPSLAQARLALWAVHNEIGEHENALTAVRQVPATHALARDAAFLSSVSLLQLGRHQEAFDALTELNRATVDGSLLNNLGVVQLRRPPVGATGRRSVSYFSDAVAVEGGDSDLLFNLGYAHFLDRDLPNAIQSLREAVRRRPTDDAAHYVLGVALQMTGNAGEGARERELARRLSSEWEEWEKTQPPANAVPKGLERVRTELAIPPFRRVETEIIAAGQRNQQELAAFHIDAGRRAYLAERDDEAIASFRRAVYLSPYDAEAHLLLGRVYLRGGRQQEAVDEFTISIWSRDTVAARLALAEAYIQTQNIAGARSELQVVLGREPSSPEARRLLARLPPE